MYESYCKDCQYYEPYAEEVDDDSTIRLLVCKNHKICERLVGIAWRLSPEDVTLNARIGERRVKE